MARYCKGLLCSRSNVSFMIMIAVLAEAEYQVFDMLSDKHVGPMPSAASVNPSSVNAFRCELDKQVEGMWLDRDICVVQITGKKEPENFVNLLHKYVIMTSFDDYAETMDEEEAAARTARLHGYLAEWNQLHVVKITKYEPARVGWGLGQNRRVRKHAAALSVLVPYLLDRNGGQCENNQFLSSFCTAAKAKRPPAA